MNSNDRAAMPPGYASQDITGRAGILHATWGAVRRAAHIYTQWRMRRATLRILRSLDDRVLKDIGLSRGEAQSLVYGENDGKTRRHQMSWE